VLYTEKFLYDLSLLYSVLGLTDRLNAFFPLGKNKKEKNNISVWPSFQMQKNPRKPRKCLVLKNQEKKSAKSRNLVFLKNCEKGRGESKKPTKN
jgi:hypothetical protein